MKINDFNFKNYLMCKNYYNLENIYEKKLQSTVNGSSDLKTSILKKMYDFEGNSLIKKEVYDNEGFDYLKKSFQKFIKKNLENCTFEKTFKIHIHNIEVETNIDCINENEDSVDIIKLFAIKKDNFIKKLGRKKIIIEESSNDDLGLIFKIISGEANLNCDYLLNYTYMKFVYENSCEYNPYKNTKYFICLLDENSEDNFCLIDISNIVNLNNNVQSLINEFIQNYQNYATELKECNNAKCLFYHICNYSEKPVVEHEYLNVENIKKEISKLKYPIYFLDFESYSSAYPRFEGEKPYEQHVFMYCLLCQKSKGSVIEQIHYIVKDNLQDYREELFSSLISNVGIEGSIIVYNETFEKSRISEAASKYKGLQNHLESINDRIVDLLYILKGNKNIKLKNLEDNNYYNTLQRGSYSIKKVLPLFSNENYNGLDICNGVEASISYSNFHKLNEEELEEEKEKLIKYCSLDVYAMYIILEGLKEKIKV